MKQRDCQIQKLPRVFTIVICLICSSCLVSCSKGLAELNENPNALTEIDNGIQLTNLLLGVTGGSHETYRTGLGYCLTLVQQMADVQQASGTYLPGDKYLDEPLYASAHFEIAYPRDYKNFADFLERTGGDEALVNYYAIGRIWRVFSAHQITDLYGDVPYFEAGLGFLDNNWNPKYDPQEEIYVDMLRELETAANLLDVTRSNPESNDLIYNGDITKWRRFAYSLMLRLGMRLTKVDPEMSEAWVKKAIEGGVMESNDDSAKIYHDPDSHESPLFGAFETRFDVRLAKRFVDWMIENNDPRISIFSYVESGGPHKGLPNGYDQVTIKEYEGGGDLLTYSQLNPDLRTATSPSIHQTYAEVSFLLAEAAIRGWYAGDPKILYDQGVRAAMEQFEIFSNIAVPSTADIDNYLMENPYDNTKGLEMIGEQYWVATFLNLYEGYANWRRTGFPNLEAIEYPNNITQGVIPRRMTYDPSEYVLNKENVEEAVSRQGPDTYLTRIWWDKE